MNYYRIIHPATGKVVNLYSLNSSSAVKTEKSFFFILGLTMMTRNGEWNLKTVRFCYALSGTPIR